MLCRFRHRDRNGCRPHSASGGRNRSLRRCAIGTIHYERVDRDATPGTLVYLKASLTGDEPTDLLSYHSRKSRFPHQSTADQWFDESQFESYRKLGYHVARSAFRESLEKLREKSAQPAMEIDGRDSFRRFRGLFPEPRL